MISRASKIRRLEDLKGAVIGISQYGSEADTFARIETDPKAKTASPSDLVDASFFKEIEKSGLIEQLYRK